MCGRPVRDPTLQLQAERRAAVRSGIGVCESGSAVRVSPAGVCRRRVLPQPELQQTTVSKNGSDQDGATRLGPQNQTGPQKGQSEIQVFLKVSIPGDGCPRGDMGQGHLHHMT